MQFFGNDLVKGVMGALNNNNYLGGGSEKQYTLRNNLEKCTYADETKYLIEKAVKQLLHVYPFFTPDILMFTENGQPRRYIEVKGILEIDIKGKTCKIDFNMMLPFDYPRSSPFVRIVNRNLDYKVDPFYQSLQSKTDPSSFVLNQKLSTVKGWAPSSSLVNVVMECYDTFKLRFPFSKPVAENNMYGGSGNAWDNLYNSKNPPINNGFNNVPANNWNNNNAGWNNNQANQWGTTGNNWANNNNGWGNNPNNGWVNPNTNANTNANTWGTGNNTWNNGGMGGMGGIISGGGVGVTNSIASAQKLVGKQKQVLQQINASYAKLIDKNQLLDATKYSLQTEQSYLRKENFQMAKFLKENDKSQLTITNIVQPKDVVSEQILDLISGIKAREQCVRLLQNKFNQQQISMQEFLKHVRKLEQIKFEEMVLLKKCVKMSS